MCNLHKSGRSTAACRPISHKKTSKAGAILIGSWRFSYQLTWNSNNLPCYLLSLLHDSYRIIECAHQQDSIYFLNLKKWLHFTFRTHGNNLTTTSKSQLSTIEGRNRCRNAFTTNASASIIRIPQSPNARLAELSNLSHFVKVKQ